MSRVPWLRKSSFELALVSVWNPRAGPCRLWFSSVLCSLDSVKLAFNSAHVHHAMELYASLVHRKWQTTLVVTACRLLYTTLFGAFATYLYFRTRRLVLDVRKSVRSFSSPFLL